MDAYPQEVWFQFLVNLSRYIDSRISLSRKHSAQVAFWARDTARLMDRSEHEVQTIFWAAMLHDIGKIGVPDDILVKCGPLDDDEWYLMRLHPTLGANIVRSAGTLAHIAPLIEHHQERFDGTGYPSGLRGEDIPFGARMLAVVDAYEAMTNNRVYRAARHHGEAADELRRGMGSQFDPQVVEAFLTVVEKGVQPPQNGSRSLSAVL